MGIGAQINYSIQDASHNLEEGQEYPRVDLYKTWYQEKIDFEIVKTLEVFTNPGEDPTQIVDKEEVEIPSTL